MNSDKKPAEIIICNAKVLTIDSQFSKAEALAISEGRILAVGMNHQIEAFNGPATKVIYAAGRQFAGVEDIRVNSDHILEDLVSHRPSHENVDTLAVSQCNADILVGAVPNCPG